MRALALVVLLTSTAFADIPVGGACKKDAECAVGAICDAGVCTPLPKKKWIPPFYFEQGGEVGYRHLILPPLYFSDWDRERKLHVAPEILLWVKKFPDGGHEFGWLPFVYWRAEAGERTLAVPLVLAGMHATATREFSTALLLWWRWKNLERGTDHALFLPFFEWESERHGRKQRFVSLVAAWDKDDDARMKQLVLYAPFVYARRDPVRDVDVVPPLFTRWRVHDDGSQGIIAGPFFHHSDPEGSTSGLIPLFFRFADTKAHAETDFLFPIAGWHKHPGAAGAFVGPIYGWSSKNGLGGWGAGIAPLFFAGRTGEKHHQVILPPAFIRWSNDKEHSSTTVVGPIFAHQVKDGGGWDAGVFPFLYFGKRGPSSYTVIPPLVFARSNPDETLAVIGPIFGGAGKHGYRGGVAPIVWFGRKDDVNWQFVLPPLFARVADRDHEKVLVGPFWHERDGAVRTDSLFPLFYLRRSPTEALLVSPVAGWKKEPRKETIVIGPYGYQRNDRKHSRTHFLFPLGAIHDAPDYHVVVEFPFFWRIREKDETDTAFFPLYFRVRSDAKKLDALFPIFLHQETRAAKTTLLGPIWYRARTDGGKSAGVFPLFAWGKSVKPDGRRSSWFGMPGVYWAKNEIAGNSELVAGPVFRVERPEGYTAGLIPLAFAWRRGTASKVVTPIFYRQAESAWDYDLNVLGPVYWGKKGTERKFGLFPLLFTKWDKAAGTSTTVLFPLLGVTKKRDGALFSTALFGFSTYAGGSRGWFGPFYGRRDREEASGAFWPLVYVNRNHVTGSSTTMALPFLFDGRAADGRELQMYTPLIWRYKSVESDISVGLPLWFDVKRPGESRTTSLLPFFVRNRSSVFKSTSWFFPPILTWVRKHDGGGSDFSFFPLVWHFAGHDSTTVVFPLFWDVNRGESKTQVLFPIYARWRRSDGDSALYLNCYVRRGRGPKEGEWYVDIMPLAQFGHPRKGDVTFKLLEGLIGYSRTGRNRILHLFWIFDVPLAPAPASSLTWWSSTPPSARTEF